MTGLTFGRWTVVSASPGHVPGAIRKWTCLCSCGTTRDVEGASLRRGQSTSCGCMRRSNKSRTRLYFVWRGMRNRCYDAQGTAFMDYGGRGITVCARWLASFEDFVADMGPRPPGTSLDRIDVDGNYEPGNCRWATKEQQDNNKRATVMVEYDGRMMPAAAWSKELGIKLKTITARVRRGFRGARALAPVLAAAARGGK